MLRKGWLTAAPMLPKEAKLLVINLSEIQRGEFFSEECSDHDHFPVEQNLFRQRGRNSL